MYSALKNVGKFVGLSSSQADPKYDEDRDDTMKPERQPIVDGEVQDTPTFKKSKKSRKRNSAEDLVLTNEDVEAADVERTSTKLKKKKTRVATDSKLDAAAAEIPESQVEDVGEAPAKALRGLKSKRVPEEELANGHAAEMEVEPVKAKKSKKSKKAAVGEEDVDGVFDARAEAKARPKKQAKAKKVTEYVDEDVPAEVMEGTMAEQDAENISELINSTLNSHKKHKKSKKSKSQASVEMSKAAETQDYFEHDRAKHDLAPPPEPLDAYSGRRHSSGSSQNDLLAASQLLELQRSPVERTSPPTNSKKSATSEKKKEKSDGMVGKSTTKEPRRDELKQSKKSKKSKDNANADLIPDSQPTESRPTPDNRERNVSVDLDQPPIDLREAPPIAEKPRKPTTTTKKASKKASIKPSNSEVDDHINNESSASKLPPNSQPASSWAAINTIPAKKTSEKKPEIYKATPKSAKKRSIPVDVAELPGSAQPKKRVRTSTTNPKMSSNNHDQQKESTRPLPQNCTAKGKLTTIEEKLIKDAVEKFRDMNNMTDWDINDLVDQNAQHNKKAHELWEWVQTDLPNRDRLSIIRHARRKFSNAEQRGGSWTEEADEDLRKAHAKDGPKWRKIAKILGRTHEDVRDRWRNYLICEDNKKTNTWDDAEEVALREAVDKFLQEQLQRKQQLRDEGNDVDVEVTEADIQWPKISEYMGYQRSRLQCSTKWKQLQEREALPPRLLSKNIPTPSNSWRQQRGAEAYERMKMGDKYILVTGIRDSRAGSEQRIPWHKIGGADFTTYFNTMIKKQAWIRMRSRVDGWNNMSLQEVVTKVIDSFGKCTPKQLQERYDGSEEPERSTRKYSLPKKDTVAKEARKKIISDERVAEDDLDDDEQVANEERGADAKAERRARKRARKEKETAKVRHRMSRNGESQEPEDQANEAAYDDDGENTMVNPDESLNAWLGGNSKQSIQKSNRRYHEKANRISDRAAVARAYDSDSLDGEDISTSTPRRLGSPFKPKKRKSSALEVEDSDS